jgi:hypothetical protein
MSKTFTLSVSPFCAEADADRMARLPDMLSNLFLREYDRSYEAILELDRISSLTIEMILSDVEM